MTRSASDCPIDTAAVRACAAAAPPRRGGPAQPRPPGPRRGQIVRRPSCPRSSEGGRPRPRPITLDDHCEEDPPGELAEESVGVRERERRAEEPQAEGRRRGALLAPAASQGADAEPRGDTDDAEHESEADGPVPIDEADPGQMYLVAVAVA